MFEDPSKSSAQIEQARRAWRTYAIWRPDYRIVVDAKPVPLDTYAKVLSAFEVREQQMFLTSRILFQVNKGERHRVRFELPSDWEILNVRHAEEEVDWAESVAAKKRIIEVELASRLGRGDTYVCEVRCRRSPDDWLARDWVTRTVSMPKVWVQDATTQDGILAVASDDSFELNDLDLTALKSMDTRKLSEMGYASAGLRLGYSYQREYGGSLEVIRRSPRIGAVVTQYVRMERDVYRVHALVDFDIKHAATDALWIELPKGIGKEVEIRGPQIKERGLVEREGATGDVWKIGLYRKWVGAYRMTVSYERSIASGKNRVQFGNIKALDIHRQSGFIAVEASSDIEIHPQTRNLIEVDVSQIPNHPSYRSASRIIYAYKWLTPSYELLLDIIRHQEVNVLSTAVSQANYTTVVSTDGTARTQVTLTLRNASMSSLPIKLPPGSRLWSAFSDGKPVKPARTGELLAIPIPIAEQQEKVFPVILTYESELGGLSAFGSLSLAGVRVAGVPVISTHWSLYLPPGFQYLGYGGNMEYRSVPPVISCLNNLRSLGELVAGLGRDYRIPRGGGDAQRASSKELSGQAEGGGEVSSDFAMDAIDGRVDPIRAERFGEPPAKEDPDNEDITLSTTNGSVSGRDENLTTGDGNINLSSTTGLGAPPSPGLSPPAEAERDPAAPQIKAEGRGFQSLAGIGTSYAARQPVPRRKKQRLDELKLLSMEIEIPASGTVHSFKRLGGNPDVRVTFVSRNAAEWVGIILTISFVALSVWLCTAKQMHALFLLIISAVVFVGLLMAISEVLRPYCDAALFGVAIFAVYRFCRWVGAKCMGLSDPASVDGPSKPRALLRDRSKITSHFRKMAMCHGLLAKPCRSRCSHGLASNPWHMFRYTKWEVTSAWPLVLALLLLPALFGPPSLFAEETKQKRNESKWMPERTIYVPYNPKDKELPKKLEKVYLPYEDFMELWERANPGAVKKGKKPVVPYTISNAVYKGRLEGLQAVFDARFEIRTFSDEWTKVQLRLTGAIRQAKLGEREATLSPGRRGYSLGLDKKGRHVLTVTFAVPAQNESGTGKFSFAVPRTPTTVLSFVLPSADLDVVLDPAHGGQRITQVNGQPVLEGKLGSVNSVTLRWSPKAGRSANGIAAHVEVRNQSVVTLREAYVETRSHLALNVTRKAINTLLLQVGKPLTVYGVEGEKVKGWAIDADDPDRIRVSFLESVSDKTTLQIDAGAKTDGEQKPFGVPLISAVGVARESGTVVLASQPNLKCEVLETTGMRRINLTRGLGSADVAQGFAPLCAFAYSSGPVSLRAKVEPAASEFAASVDSLFSIDADEIALQSRLTLTLKSGPIFGAEVDLPLSWKVKNIKGAPVKEWWLTSHPGVQRVNISFKSPIRTKAILSLEATSPVTGTDDILFVNPRVRGTIEQPGTMVLAAFRDYTLRTLKAEGLRPLDIRNVAAEHQVSEGFTPVMAYSYIAPEHRLSVARSEVTPMVTATSVTHVTVESGTMRCAITLRYNVRRAAIDTCEFSLPESVGNQIDVKSPLVRQVRSSVAGEGMDARRVWTLKLHAPKTGLIDHSFTLELPLPDKADIQIPRPDIIGVDRARAYVVLTNQSEYIVKEKVRKNIREVPLKELPFFPVGGQVNRAATAYSARSDDWKLEFAKELTTMQELTEASVDWAEIKISISEEGKMLSKVTYHMQNRTEQYLELEMPDGSEIWSVFVADKPVRPAVIERENRTNTLIPLVKTSSADLAFDVEIVYEHRLPEGFGTSGREELLGPKVIKVPVIKTLLTVHLPENHRFFLFGGNVDEIISEVSLVEKVESLVREQVQLLRSYESSQKISFSRKKAQSNLKKLDKKIEESLAEVERRNAIRLRQSKRKELGRYQQEKFEDQIAKNHDDGVSLLQLWSDNKFQQEVLDKQFSQQQEDQEQSLTIQGSQSAALANIDLQRPDAPLLQCQAVFEAGNKQSAWAQLGPYRQLLKTHHRNLSPEFRAFVVTKLIESREAGLAITICRQTLISQGKGGTSRQHRATFQNLLGDCYMADERYDIARDEYTTTMKHYPKSREATVARLKIAETLLAQKIFAKANEILDEFSHETDLKLKAKAAAMNAMVFQAQGDVRKAQKFYSEAINLGQMVTGKNREGVQKDLGDLLTESDVHAGKYKEALDTLRLIGAFSGEVQKTVEPGKNLRIRLSDRNLTTVRGMDRVPIIVTTTSGDRVHTILKKSQAGRGLFVAEIETKRGPVNRRDRALQVKGGDEITYRITGKEAELMKDTKKSVPEVKIKVVEATGTGFPSIGEGGGGGGGGDFFGREARDEERREGTAITADDDVLLSSRRGQVDAPALVAKTPEPIRKTGLLSIRVDIPQTSNVYHFKKLRGGAKLSFRHLSKESTGKLGNGTVMLLLLALAFGARTVLRRMMRNE